MIFNMFRLNCQHKCLQVLLNLIICVSHSRFTSISFIFLLLTNDINPMTQFVQNNYLNFPIKLAFMITVYLNLPKKNSNCHKTAKPLLK